MSSRSEANESRVIREDAALAGILALLIEEREERTGENRKAVRVEVLLAGVGLSIEEIAAVTGRSYDSVRMAISRARAKK